MNGREMILDRIKADCEQRIKAVKDNTAQQIAEIKEQAQSQADKNSAEIARRAGEKVKQINASSKSRAELETRNAVLRRKRKEIDITLDAILEYILALDDAQYFKFIYELASKLSVNEGEIYLNKRDLKRLPSDFSAQLEKSGVKASVSKTAVDICGGFILKSGDIEENMEISAVINSKRDGIEDIINRELFCE